MNTSSKRIILYLSRGWNWSKNDLKASNPNLCFSLSGNSLMAIPLTHYVKVKNNYCIGYFGSDENVILKLIKSRPIIEKELQGIRIYIACNEEMSELLIGEVRVVYDSELDDLRNKVAYFRELEPDETVEDLLNESNIPFDAEDLK